MVSRTFRSDRNTQARRSDKFLLTGKISACGARAHRQERCNRPAQAPEATDIELTQRTAERRAGSPVRRIVFLIPALVGLYSCGGDGNNNNANQTATVGGINVHQSNRVASIILDAQAYENFRQARGDSRMLARRLYEHFEDHFDFIALVANESERARDDLPFGSFVPIQSNVRGIGRDQVFDNSASYGSAGRLKGILSLFTLNALTLGPSLHELAHCCANYLFRPGARAIVADILGPHWGFTGGSSPGQLGGFAQSTLRENTDGGPGYTVSSFAEQANGGNSIPYNELELYLMGFIPVEQVSPFDAFSGISDVTAVTRGRAIQISFNATTRTSYTPEILLERFGPRVPSSAESQKDFRMLVVAVSNRELTPEQWDTAARDSERFGRNSDDGNPFFYNFWEATGGRGSMETGRLGDSVRGAVTR